MRARSSPCLELAARRADRLDGDVLDDDVRRHQRQAAHRVPGGVDERDRAAVAVADEQRLGRVELRRAARAARRAPPRGRTPACAGARGGSERPWPKREKASTRRPVASRRACGKPRHSPTEPRPSCRSTRRAAIAVAGQVGDLDREPVDRGHGASLVSGPVRSATRCATCEHAARDRRRALDPARGRARDDRDRALPELAARRARTRPRGLRRAVALVGRRPRGLLGLGLGLLRRARARALRARPGRARDARRRVVPGRAPELRRARAGDRRGHRPRWPSSRARRRASRSS